MAQNRQTDKPAEAHTAYVPVYHRRWFWPAAAAAVLVLLLVWLVSLWAVGGPRHLAREHGLYGPRGGAMRNSGFGSGIRPFDNGMSDNQSRLTGVVTSINGSTFTIAGHGTTNDVETNNSTQWQGGSQVRVNDSVVVFGSVSNGKFTASRVVVNP